MKILTLCYEYPPIGGGGGRLAHAVAAALVGRGHAVRVITAAMRDLPAREQRDGVEIFRVRGLRARRDACSVAEMGAYVATAFFSAWGQLRAWRPDVMHAHFAVPTGALAWPLRWITGTPYVLTVHLGDLPGGNPDQTDHLFRVLNPFIRPIWQHAAAVTASSTFAADLARTAYGFSPQIILNGVSMEGLLDAAPEPSAVRQLVAVGRFNPQKNFPWMLEMLGTLAGRSDWHLTLVGDGPQHAEITAAIERHNLAQRVTLAGWVSEVRLREILRASDIFLMPSTSEGNPLAAIEALKAGLAIVGSDIGGLADLISHGENGLRLGLGAASDFASELAALLDDPATLHAMKSRSLARARHFDITAIADAFAQVLERSAR